MTPVTIFDQRAAYGRCRAFWRACVQLGLIRAIKLKPVTVMQEEWEAFAMSLNPEIIRQVNAKLRSYEKKSSSGEQTPALPGPRRRGRRPGSGQVSSIVGEVDSISRPGSGGTRAGAPSGASR